MSRNRSLWTLGAILPIIITLCTDTILPKKPCERNYCSWRFCFRR